MQKVLAQTNVYNLQLLTTKIVMSIKSCRVLKNDFLRHFYAVYLQHQIENSHFMYTYKYPHPAVTTDCVIFGFDGTSINILLIERGIEPYIGTWALPGAS